MAILSIRLSEEEKRLLAERAHKAGLSSGALVRRWLQEEPLVTGDDLLAEIERILVDPDREKLRVRRK